MVKKDEDYLVKEDNYHVMKDIRLLAKKEMEIGVTRICLDSYVSKHVYIHTNLDKYESSFMEQRE